LLQNAEALPLLAFDTRAQHRYGLNTLFSTSAGQTGPPHAARRSRGLHVAKSELGTKRIDPETGKKFYDLNKDPVVSPYTGKSYPLSFFAETSAAAVLEKQAEEEEIQEVDTENENVEVVSLEDADEEASGGEDLPDLGDDDVDIGDDDDDNTFLEQDEDEEDDDMSGLIGVPGDDEEA
jgi:uncharacterized protein (TIGR02300 family)